MARDGARWYKAARWGPHHAFSLSTECRSASGCHSAGRVCCHPVLDRSAGHRRALCGGSAALREGRLGRGLRERDGASSKIRTSARASDGGSGWGLRGWGFPRSAQGLMADAAAVSPLGGGRHGAAQGEGRREGPRSPRDALRRRFPPRLSSETPVTGITERTRRPVFSLLGRTAQNLRRPYRFLSTDFYSLLHARTSLGHVFAWHARRELFVLACSRCRSLTTRVLRSPPGNSVKSALITRRSPPSAPRASLGPARAVSRPLSSGPRACDRPSPAHPGFSAALQGLGAVAGDWSEVQPLGRPAPGLSARSGSPRILVATA